MVITYIRIFGTPVGEIMDCKCEARNPYAVASIPFEMMNGSCYNMFAYSTIIARSLAVILMYVFTLTLGAITLPNIR